MYDTAERLRRVKLRARELRCNKENRLLGGLSAVCVVLLVSITGVIGIMTGGAPGMVSGFYGATLLYDDAGAYVLVGMLAFVAGVIVTMLCLRYRGKNRWVNTTRRRKRNEKKDC